MNPFSRKTPPAAQAASAMRRLDKRPQLGRRGFLRHSGLGAIGVTVIPVAGLALSPMPAHAESFKTLGAETGSTLVRMARDIFPHDRLAERFYLQSQAPYDAAAAKDAALLKLISEGVEALNGQAQKQFGKPYAQVPTEAQRVQLLKAIESTPFFQKIKGDLVTGLYDNKEVWPQLGYEGSSWDKGGYLNRGFNDIDWL